MKVNAKLGGTTCFLDKSDHPLFGKEASIIVGADVSHPAPGINKASFASMVGSTDSMLLSVFLSKCLSTFYLTIL